MLLLWAVLSGALSGELDAAVSLERSYIVELTYQLELPPDAAVIPLRVLEAKGGRLHWLEANGSVVALDRSRAPQLEAELEVPASAATLRLRYEVTGTTIPVVVPLVEGLEARAGMFRASVELPFGAHLAGSFPTGAVMSNGVYHFELPVLPAFVSLMIVDDAPLLSFEAALDVAAVLFFLAIGVFLVRRR